ncbi:uncharacterized protein LOC126669562 [Mercurialis annua]|uniref:uncharacterized protein LOC126669562 n=1 Tax=Mercurialis annua TaxID=3986 RepID=UPI00215E9B38|nr:uncharacterized protein LOC126669562 [Mercurialis annua]
MEPGHFWGYESQSDFQILDEDDGNKLLCLKADFEQLSKHIESLWNTKYFHIVAAIHSKNNSISEIFINGICYSSPSEIKQGVQSFYKDLFHKEPIIHYSLDSLPIKSLTDLQAGSLSIQFCEHEILDTLMSCDGNKAPGLDGFNYFFYKKASFPVGLNTAFLVLIPKFQGASDIKDFRPISLINGVFKLISKVLANRLSPLLPLIISENQFGFIKGRSTHECNMIATDIIHLVKFRREQVFLIKLDFRKAFNTISWSFILQMLHRINFDQKWISRISSFFDSTQLSVLLNGSPTENFFMGKGVHQGDPISPMLFVLAVESLKALLSKAIGLGLFSGVQVDGLDEPVSILQFADDTLIFVPNDLQMVENLLHILRCFELISGLKINYQKSSIIGINVDQFSLSKASDILNCKIKELPVSYFGLPNAKETDFQNIDHASCLYNDKENAIASNSLVMRVEFNLDVGSSRKTLLEGDENQSKDQLRNDYNQDDVLKSEIEVVVSLEIGIKLWDPVVASFNSQLSTWRDNLIAPAGRLTLIKSVLCSLPVYFLGSFCIPCSVADSLERIIRRFLWNGNVERRGFSKVAWAEVCLPFKAGGLNITPLRTRNICLLMKWLWKLMVYDENSLWFGVISSSSSIPEWFDIEGANTLHLSHIWKGIYNVCMKNRAAWECFTSSVFMCFGDGIRIRFWKDRWLKDDPLYILFPALFRLCRDKDSMISSFFDPQQGCFSRLN